MYLESLSDKEKIGIEIAEKQLGSSFCLERSLGYLKFWKGSRARLPHCVQTHNNVNYTLYCIQFL